MKFTTTLSVFALLPFIFAETSKANEVATEGAEAGKWTMDYSAAAKLAKEKDLPMLLNFTGSDWCGWCKLMDGDVFAEKAWEEYASSKVVLVTIDFPKDKTIVPEKFVSQNQELKTKFGIRGYPTYMVLDSDGESILGKLGAGRGKTPESFIEELEGVLRFRPANMEAKIAELGEAKGAEYKEAIAGMKTAEDDLKAWLQTKPPRNDENNKKFEAFQKSIQDAREKVNSF